MTRKVRVGSNADKIILDLCGGTGAWSKPYRDAGYDVRLITLPDNDVRTYIPPDNVYGILAAPPCTEFSLVKNFHGDKCKRDFAAGLAVADACLRLSIVCKPVFWALENPKGLLRRWYGEPVLVFDPCDYGDPYKKKTCLWGRFNIPKTNPCQMPSDWDRFAHVHSKDIAPEFYGKLTRQERRAITPAGFAKAFFKVNP